MSLLLLIMIVLIVASLVGGIVYPYGGLGFSPLGLLLLILLILWLVGALR